MATEQRTQPKDNLPSGIYLGLVISHLDTKFNGSLEVEILKRTDSGNLSARTGQIVQAKYLSPFSGATPYKDMTRNSGWNNTQKGYGWWAIPPDAGSLVMVLFAENNYSQAYWIGCVQDEFMNFMIPGNASTTYNDKDRSKALPVGEYNKKVETGTGRDPTKFIKPHNPFAFEKLEEAGLTTDHIRGTTTSSARREVPSMVFGVSTPGPVDRKGPTARYGPAGSESNVPFSRLGGSSFVMDDGDMSLLRKNPPSGKDGDKLEYASVEEGSREGNEYFPANELIRLKTRSGHQILLHNTEDLIYISHGSGNSWIEMTGNGKIDVYAKDSISFHTENDFNFNAGRDINFRANGDINLTADVNFRATAREDFELYADKNGKIRAGEDTNIYAGGNHKETTGEGGKIYMNSDNAAEEASRAHIPKRVPRHEPWKYHENLDPKAHVPDETKALDPSEQISGRDRGYEEPNEENFVFPNIPDTFKRPT